MVRDNLTGKQFNSYTVISFSEVKNNRTMWLCRCVCGTEKTISQNNLIRGATKSCGCSRKKPKQNLKSHGLKSNPVYSVWTDIKRRCEDPRIKAYAKYGAVGVKMHEPWKDVNNFYDWCKSNGWRKGLCVCRNGDVGDYSPDNCYIATKSQNSIDKYIFKKAA